MPTVNSTQEGGVIRWDSNDWMSGLLPTSTTNTIKTIPNAEYGMTAMSGIDPFRIPGVLMPAFSARNPTNSSVLDALLKNGVVSGTNCFIVGGNKVHRMDIANNTITNNAVYPNTSSTPHGGHSSLSMSDCVTYYIGTTKYLFYSWYDSADGDIGRHDLATAFDDDYMSTVAASGAVLSTTDQHPLIVGADDIMYIGDGRKLHGFDGQTGANGTFLTSRLTLPLGSVITSMAKTANYLVIFAYTDVGAGVTSQHYYKSRCAAYFWDYVSEDPTLVVPIQGNYVNGAFAYAGTVGCFINDSTFYDFYGTGKQSKLLMYNGGVFDTLAVFGESIPGHGGVEVIDKMVIWNAGGSYYKWGSPYVGFPNVFIKSEQGSSTTAEGMCRQIGGSRFIGSSKTIADTMDVFYDRYSVPSFTCPIKQVPLRKYSICRAKSIKIFFYADPESGSHYINYLRLISKSSTKDVINGSSYVGGSRQNPSSTPFVEIDLMTHTGTAFELSDGIGLSCAYTSGDNTKIPPIIEAIEVYYEYENI